LKGGFNNWDLGAESDSRQRAGPRVQTTPATGSHRSNFPSKFAYSGRQSAPVSSIRKRRLQQFATPVAPAEWFPEPDSEKHFAELNIDSASDW